MKARVTLLEGEVKTLIGIISINFTEKFIYVICDTGAMGLSRDRIKTFELLLNN